MKSKVKLKLLFYIGFIVVFSFLITSHNFFGLINSKTQNLKPSKPSGRIHIIGNSGWADFKAAGKCTGNGSYLNPYVIEDLEIDGGNIVIEDSDVYFRIENCSLFNWGGDSGGIMLKNVKNSIITNNYLNNNTYGIYAFNCENCVISNNSVQISYIGIRVGGTNNKILNNNVTKSERAGIYLGYSQFNVISENYMSENRYGIEIYNSDDNTISGNCAFNNIHGIRISAISISWEIIAISYRNKILGNIAIDNQIGIVLSGGSDTNVSNNIMIKCGLMGYGYTTLIDATNLVNGRPLYYYSDKNNLGPSNFTNAGQVILFNCHDSTISHVNTSKGSIGISLYNCNNNIITCNNASYNKLYGIYLYDSDNNTISGNTMNNNGNSIYLRFSDINIISGNTMNNNGNSISLSSSDYNIISGNTINNNQYYGIYLRYCYNNTISNNTLIGNGVCISEYECEGNIFRNNGSCLYGIQQISVYYLFLIYSVSLVLITILNYSLIRFKKKKVR